MPRESGKPTTALLPPKLSPAFAQNWVKTGSSHSCRVSLSKTQQLFVRFLVTLLQNKAGVKAIHAAFMTCTPTCPRKSGMEVDFRRSTASESIVTN